jgi:ABC-2 type transport system permease protein
MRSLRIIFHLCLSHLRILTRMRAILLVIFLPGLVTYWVFTKIFEGPAGSLRPFRVAVVDDDQTPASHDLVDALAKSNTVLVRTENEEPGGPVLTPETARRQIRKSGKYRVAVVIPKGFSTAPNAMSGPEHRGVDLIYDETQPMEADAVVGMLQMAAGRALFEKMFKPFDPGSGPAGARTPSRPPGQPDEERMLLKVQKAGISIERMQIASKHIFLAGIVPLFLLFTCANAARGLLEELSSGGIKRLLAAPIRPAHILLSQQLFALVLALVQCAAMYLFAWLVFGVAIGEIAGGLAVLTLATCLATTGFGMLLASFCRNSQQLDAIGTTVILAMGAIGGSMVPRFIMPPFMQKLGLLTVNGWAYDGFIALIRNEGFGLASLFRDGEVMGIWPPCLVLLLVAAACSTAGSILLTRRLRAGPGA